MALLLRLLASRVPYRRAKVSFEPNGAQSFGVAMIDPAELPEGGLDQLLEDPHIDVTVSIDGGRTFQLLASAGHLAELAELADELERIGAEEAADLSDAEREAERLLIEQARGQAAGPIGDEADHAMSAWDMTETTLPPDPPTGTGAGADAPAAGAAKEPEPPRPHAPKRAGGGRRT